jgi:LDH2 family malate/lactate/ureidoglycolate dehydrogenase
MSSASRISPENLEKFCTEALLRTGMNPGDARRSAAILVMTDTFGVFTHGVKSLRGYVRRLRAGGLRANQAPAIAAEGPGWAVIDGHSALGMVTSTFAMDVAIAKARATGIGYAGVKNSCHFGAAGTYALQAADADMIGIAVSNDKPSVSIPGSRGPVLGSNPLAYAVPTGTKRAIFMDISTAAVAGGKVYQAQRFGRSIPPTWLIDDEGVPTTDPKGYPETKTLMPMAAHKGYGLALLIEVLSGALSGAALTKSVGSWMADDPSRPTDHGAAFIAINIGAMVPMGIFKAIIDTLSDEIRTAPLAKGAERVYLPGEMEWDRRDRALQEGIELPADVVESLEGLSADLQLPLSFSL